MELTVSIARNRSDRRHSAESNRRGIEGLHRWNTVRRLKLLSDLETRGSRARHQPTGGGGRFLT